VRVLVAAAVAMAFALGIRSWLPRSDLDTSRLATARSPVVLGARMGFASGETEVDGRPPEVGATIGADAVVTTRGGTACLLVDDGIRACLAPATRVRVVAIGGGDRRLAVLVGRVVAELEPQPPGTSFTLEAPDGTATAIGTAFSVEVPEDGGPSITRVLHGTVLVRPREAPARRVGAHAQTAMIDAPTAPLPVTDEARDLTVLAGALGPDLAPSAAVAMAPTSAPPVEPRGAARRGAPDGDDALSLLRAAREMNARGDVPGAAAAYRALLARHPSTPEAVAGELAYGELQLGPLGDAAGALRTFERYLAHGGSLAEEASYGRIRALRALGRDDEERAAIEAFLRTYPDGAVAASLRLREESRGGPR
jgi:hypothetical protein